MFRISNVTDKDKDFWFTLDGHFKEQEFALKVRDKRGYVIWDDDNPVGILRYGLFWDNTPFLNLIYLVESYRRRGFGEKAISYWEEEMRLLGYKAVMTSTQVDEDAQHFYRKIGYKDVGGLVLEIPGYEQPMEMFMMKSL
ncbi:MAG: GNAT family N-acetyltransferase [Herbinix sp.]|nr:GNAT family N-acetyltransferase [Herbinix sp.]